MKHPEALLIPVMMLLDYYLTIATVSKYEERFAKLFVAKNFELNPFMQSEVAEKKKFSLPFFTMMIIFSTSLVLFSESGRFLQKIIPSVLGFFITVYAMIVGSHVSNLLLCRYLRRNPDVISGQVLMTYRYQLHRALYGQTMVALPVFAIAIFSPSPFVFGAALGMVSLFVTVAIWIIRERRLRSLENEFFPDRPDDSGIL